MADDVRRYREAGFNDCASKPVDFEELRQAFEQGLPDSLAHLAAHIEQEQWDDAETAAHALKGKAGSFGYQRVTELALELERSVRSAAFDRARQTMDVLWELEEIQRLLARPKAAAE